MARRKKPAGPPGAEAKERAGGATLKDLAHHLGLSPATVSLVLNRSPVADAIPAATHERVFRAAREFDYRPNYLARSLRARRSYSVGVVVQEISEGYAAGVMNGIEGCLLDEGYFYLVASHRCKPDLLEEYINLLKDRLVEGFLLVNAPAERSPGLPAVAVAGHRPLAGVTNVVIDHEQAARLALSHLAELGHRRIAFFKGHPGSADTEDRWAAILSVASALGLSVAPRLTLQLSGSEEEAFTPQEGYREGYYFGRKLLAAGDGFTALFAFNDVSAIGAMRALHDAGLSIPGDVSVVGFDDILGAAFQNPSLTTVQQPLREMGETAARILLRRLAQPGGPCPERVTVEPRLMVRGSTGPPPARRKGSKRSAASRTSSAVAEPAAK